MPVFGDNTKNECLGTKWHGYHILQNNYTYTCRYGTVKMWSAKQGRQKRVAKLRVNKMTWQKMMRQKMMWRKMTWRKLGWRKMGWQKVGWQKMGWLKVGWRIVGGKMRVAKCGWRNGKWRNVESGKLWVAKNSGGKMKSGEMSGLKSIFCVQSRDISMEGVKTRSDQVTEILVQNR